MPTAQTAAELSSADIRAQIAVETAKLADTRLGKLQRQLIDAEAQESAAARAAAAKAAEARDEAVRRKWREARKSAIRLQETIANYVSAYKDFVAASTDARGAATTHPLARSDLVYAINAERLVQSEIVRAHGSTHAIPPGGDAFLAAAGDPRRLTPLAVFVAGLAEQIVPKTD